MMYEMNRVNRMNMMNRPPRMMVDPFFRAMMGVEPPRRPNPMRVDVRQTPESYILEAELPGVKLADITLTAEDDVLTIGAKLPVRTREEREALLMHERRGCPHLERRFSLEGIDQEGITASCEDGILTVVLPKEKPVGAKALRHIPISAPVAPATPVLPEGEAAPAE